MLLIMDYRLTFKLKLLVTRKYYNVNNHGLQAYIEVKTVSC